MTVLSTAQPGLFDTPDDDAPGTPPAASRAAVLPDGLLLDPSFIDPATEQALLALAASLPLHEARYKQYTARRRVVAWGAQDNVEEGTVGLGGVAALPPPLQRLRERLAGWVGVAAHEFRHVMVSEYRPGTPLGWHRDAPAYELIAGVSLAGTARMRWRPWPPDAPRKQDIVALDLAPRSAYVMRGPARWAWQHSVAAVPALRYSVTMRTLRR